MMPATEVEAQRATTASLITIYGTMITLRRPSDEWEKTPSGGQIRKDLPSDLTPVKRWFQMIGHDAPEMNNMGEQSYVAGILVGLQGDDILKDDEFIAPNGLRYRVHHIRQETLAFETRAEVYSIEG